MLIDEPFVTETNWVWGLICAASVSGLWTVFFFFSSRRRHTRCSRDWSSDVCSSDLTPGAAEAYAAARQAPQVLDGVHCYCECAKHLGHRSLLTCFETEHGAQCDICMGEAVLAARLASQGGSLDEVRRAIDQRFGS